MARPTGVWALALGVSLAGGVSWPTLAEAAEARELHLDAGPLTEELGRLVRAELPDHVLVPHASARALDVRVRRVDTRLDVEIARGESRVRRRVLIERGLAPALRVVAFVIAEAAQPGRASVAFEDPRAGALAARIRASLARASLHEGSSRPRRDGEVKTSTRSPSVEPRPAEIVDPIGAIERAQTSTTPPIERAPERGTTTATRTPELAVTVARTSTRTAEPGDTIVLGDDGALREPGSEPLIDVVIDEPPVSAEVARGPWSVSASMLGIVWQRPTVPQVGVSIAGALALGRWSLGLGVEGAGQLCCGLSTAEVADGRASSWAVMGGLTRDVGVVGPLVVAAHVGLGLAVASIEGRVAPEVFSGPSPIQTEEGLEGRVRAGLFARWPLGALSPFLGLGADLRTPRLTLRLPAAYSGGRTSFDPGPWMPHVEAGVIFTPR